MPGKPIIEKGVCQQINIVVHLMENKWIKSKVDGKNGHQLVKLIVLDTIRGHRVFRIIIITIVIK